MNRASVAAAFALLVATSACTHANFRSTNAPPRDLSERSPESVEMYTASVPERPFVEVGLIETQTAGFFWNQDPFEKLRQTAAEAGCDAVVLLGTNDLLIQDHHYLSNLKGFRGTCIVWRDSGFSAQSRRAAPMSRPGALDESPMNGE